MGWCHDEINWQFGQYLKPSLLLATITQGMLCMSILTKPNPSACPATIVFSLSRTGPEACIQTHCLRIVNA